MSLIWYLSSYPSDAIIDTGLSFDAALKEGLHLVEFGILYELWIIAFFTWGKVGARKNIIAVFIAVSYGFIDELHQYFVPFRSATVIDLVKDVLGVMIAAYLFKRYYWGKKDTRLGILLQCFIDFLMPESQLKESELQLKEKESNKYHSS